MFVLSQFAASRTYTVFAIVIHFTNEFVFNSENFMMSFANHLDCSYGMSLACCLRLPT